MQSIGQLMYVDDNTLTIHIVFGVIGALFLVLLLIFVVVVTILAVCLIVKTKRKTCRDEQDNQKQ